MGVKYVKDFEFPAQAGFHSSSMPARAGMSAKDMPSRAKPNAPARGAARMESRPTMGKGQGYADGGKVKIQGRNQAEIKAAMAKAAAQRREETAKRNAEIAARKAAKPSPKSVSKDFVPPTVQNIEMSSPRSVSKDFVPQTVQKIEMPSAKKPSYGKYGLQEYAKGGKVQKFQNGGFSRTGRPLPSEAELRYNARNRVPAGGYQASDELKELQKFAKQQNMPQSYVDRIVNQSLAQPKSVPVRGGLSGGKLGAALTAASALSGLAGYLAGTRKKPTVTVEEIPQPQGKARGGRVARYAKGGAVTAPAPSAPAPSSSRSVPAMMSGAKKVVSGVAKRVAGPVGQATTANDVYNFVRDIYENARQYDQGAYGELPKSPFKNGGKVAKVMREYKKGELHSGSKKGPLVKNPKQAIAIALSEERRMKKAMGGAVDNYAGKTGPYRGSPKKAKMLGRQDRRAREAMERAEKHAPGRSIDMPDRKAHGGMMRRKVA